MHKLNGLLSLLVVFRHVISSIRLAFIVAYLPDGALRYYEYFKQLAAAGKFSDIGSAALIERDFTDQNRETNIPAGLIIDLCLTTMMALLVWKIVENIDWPYSTYGTYVALLVILSRAKIYAEVVFILHGKMYHLALFGLVAAIGSLGLLFFLKTVSIEIGVYFSLCFALLVLPVAAFLVFLKTSKLFVLGMSLPKIKDIGQFSQKAIPLLISSISFGVYLWVERLYILKISSTAAELFALFALLTTVCAQILAFFLRFERQRINKLQIWKRRSAYFSVLLKTVPFTIFVACVVILLKGALQVKVVGPFGVHALDLFEQNAIGIFLFALVLSLLTNVIAFPIVKTSSGNIILAMVHLSGIVTLSTLYFISLHFEFELITDYWILYRIFHFSALSVVLMAMWGKLQ